jgi:hypothetical protein
MDPEVVLNRLRILAEGINKNPRHHTVEEREFAEWFNDLDEWLSHGGFAPSAWTADVTVRLP